MTDKINTAVDKILDMNPDPIPKFVLLKEFKKLPPDDSEFRGLYAEVCNHSHIKSYENAQNERGFWPPFHGYTEAAIRKLLSFGLDSEHICLKNVSEYLVKVLNNQEEWNQYEKQDNPLWYTKMFVPLVSAAMLSLIDSSNPALEAPRKQWAYIAKKSFESGYYDPNKNIGAISDCFAFTTKRPIPPFNYYCLLLLSPDKASSYIDDETDKAIVDFCMTEASSLGYVYNNKPSDMVEISVQNRDSRDFWHWVRALSIVSRFHGWSAYRDKYCEWILSQANADGLWEFPKKFDFTLSNSWRGKNKVIDSSIFVLRMLNGSQTF